MRSIWTKCYAFNFKTRTTSNKSCNRRVPDIPAPRQREIISTDRDFGPRVPTIFVIAGKKDCMMALKKLQSKSKLTTRKFLIE